VLTAKITLPLFFVIYLNSLNPCPGIIYPEENDMYEECETCLRRKVSNDLPLIEPPKIIALWCEYSVHE
jgi:hypothetical protein